MFGEMDYLDSLDHFENFCNVFYKSKIPFSLTFRGSKLVVLTITVRVKGLGRECLSDVTSESCISCKIVNIVFYIMRRAKIAFELHFFKILTALCLN